MAVTDILRVSFEFSPKLGVRELPDLSSRHESNLPGLFVVGDLADAPIIKVALNQGYDVAQQVVAQRGTGPDPDVLDVIVIGAGPAGIGAALGCRDAGARYVVLERERPFATIQNFPKAKLVFSEPREILSRADFWFEDASKEDLIDRWEQAVDEHALHLHQPEEVVDIRPDGDGFTVHARVGDTGRMPIREDDPAPLEPDGEGAVVYRARSVILAIGRRGSVRRLGCPGEELEKVAYALKDPAAHAGRAVLVVGGGDSAVEAAVSCAEAGADVTVSYRKDAFARAKARNRARIEELDGSKLRVAYETTVEEVREDAVVLRGSGGTEEVLNDDVLVFIGTKLPRPFLERIGIRMNGDIDLRRWLWIGSFALMTYLFYVLKTKRGFFPFGEGHPLGFVPEALTLDLGFRAVDGGFWGTVVYSALILGFGVAAYRKYPSATQKRRYLSLMVFQALFLFGIPELLAPLVIERPWKVYALTVPWPLSIWSVVDAPSWTPDGSTTTALLWVGAGAFTSFVAMPVFVYFQGERFCSWLCGCGGLAETLGDRWRHRAPRGRHAQQAEWAGRLILVLAVPVTLLILNDAWRLVAPDALVSTKVFAERWYGLMVDFWLASVVGVAFYPYLGNRVWCRFFCPLRAYMEVLSRMFSRVQITSNERCIGCGECTRFCQMGIDVQSFAQRQVDMHNGNSACIQCGICVEVCPMNVLELEANRWDRSAK